ncbi:MAG: UvrD-helicase domain-containing protein [Clostridium sp.]|nr:UvrD-helicase domain-containing protein [Clostridium sp.]
MLSIYKASAGSGKTFTLTREYIKFLLGVKEQNAGGKYRLARPGGHRHRSILAITFTNKATEEMKRRIVHELAVLGRCEPGWTDPSPYESYFTGLFGCSADELAEASASALRDLLHDFNGFRISTIDSFFQMVLRAFAREAELTGNYELELNRKYSLNLAAGQLFVSLNDGEKGEENRVLESWLLMKVMERLRSGNAYNIFDRNSTLFNSLIKFLDNMTDETYQENREALAGYLSDMSKISAFASRLEEVVPEMDNGVRAAAVDIKTYIEGMGFTVKEVLESNCAKFVLKFADPKEKAVVGKENKSIPKMRDLNDEVFNSQSKTKIPVFRDATLESLVQAYGELSSEAIAYRPLFSDILSNTFALGLIRRVEKTMNDMLAEENTLLLAETGTIIKEIIGDSAAPFVYERIGALLRHFLIDEFQDTSKLQWHNLRKLVKEGLSNGHDSLIIGDEKQCIYRFRNSEPSLLGSGVGRDLAPYLSSGDDTGGGNTNWRSSREVVGFNNSLFAKLAANLDFGDIYSNVIQDIAEKNRSRGGYVSVTSIDKSVKTEFETAAFANMMDHIARQIKAGYRPSQIAVLVRNRKEGAAAIDYILRAGRENPDWPTLRVVSDDSMSVETSPAVCLIVSVLKTLVADTAPSTSRHISRRHYARLLGDLEELVNAGESRSEALSAVLQRNADGEYDDETETDISAPVRPDTKVDRILDMNLVNLTSIVERIVATMLPAQVRDSQNAFISCFSDLVNDYQQRGNCDIRSFLKWWETAGHRTLVNLPPDDNAVRVLTIHKSKGLEFPCVHIPCVYWSFYAPKGPEWFSLKGLPRVDPSLIPPLFPLRPSEKMKGTCLEKQYLAMKKAGTLDELNVLYVAMTRAVDELIVSLPATTLRVSNPVSAALAEALGLTPGQTMTWGEPTCPRAEKQARLTATDPVAMTAMPAYTSTDSPRLWEDTRLDDETSRSARRRQGIVEHSILASVRTLADIPVVYARAASSGIETPENAAMMASRIAGQIRDNGVERWFEGYRRISCEQEFVLADGTVRRPDRIVWLPDGSIEIVDYKTGHDTPKVHFPQLGEYVAAMRRICPEAPDVRGYIWNLSFGTVTRL